MAGLLLGQRQPSGAALTRAVGDVDCRLVMVLMPQQQQVPGNEQRRAGTQFLPTACLTAGVYASACSCGTWGPIVVIMPAYPLPIS